jgi:predicted GNAT superfamily acetyltransferase
MSRIFLRILETPQELEALESLQRSVWPGNETDIVPMHMLLAAVHSGGLAIGAYEVSETSPGSGTSPDDAQGEVEWGKTLPGTSPIGFVFSFPGLYETADGPRLKHHSHMLGVRPDCRDKGIGFKLKRAQWQMVRRQGLDRITWTYDPLLSRNAYLNIARLGAVCNLYLRTYYGQMRDELNVGLPSDRFQVDWWVNSQRVFRRLGKHPRRALDLAHFLAAGVSILNPTHIGADSLPRPAENIDLPEAMPEEADEPEKPLLLVEIPADFLALKTADMGLALEWRLHTRNLFEELFERGYLVTDFIHLPGSYPRSFYVLSHAASHF